jgi:hypothetical protein
MILKGLKKALSNDKASYMNKLNTTPAGAIGFARLRSLLAVPNPTFAHLVLP